MTHKKLHLFTVSGRTFTFSGARVETDNETVLVFTYDAASDGLRKRFVCYKTNLLGWSSTYKDEVDLGKFL